MGFVNVRRRRFGERGPEAVIETDLAGARWRGGLVAASRASTLVTLALLVGLATLLTAAVLVSDGSSNRPIFALGAGAAALVALGAVAAVTGLVARPAAGAAGTICVGLLALLVLWSGASVLWSIAPDRSWAEANRELAYLAFLCLGIGVGALLRRAPSAVAAGLGLLVAAALVWSLASKVFPELYEDGGRIARLRVPIGSWNVLGLLLVLALPIALWLASERRFPHAARGAGVLFLYGLVVGILLTYSRGGILAGIVAVLVWLALSRARLESVVALLLALPLGAGVFAIALRLPGVVDDGQALDERTSDGRLLAIALLAGAALAFLAGTGAAALEARRPVTPETRTLLARFLKIAALAVTAAALVALAVRGGDVADWVERQADEFANPPTDLLTQESERLTSLSSNNRWNWWNEAWDAFQAAPLEGTGAGSFAIVHQLLREDSLTVTDPHNAILQFLASTGVVGAVLAGGAALAALAGAFAALRRVPVREHAPALALAVGLVAYLAHSLADFDWSFVAVSAPVLVATGVLFAAGRPAARRRGSLALVPLALALAGAAIVSLGAPWLAARKVDDAYVLLGRGRPEAALEAAAGARSLNPLALDPLLARSAAEIALGDVQAARAALVDAVELQPLDADAWYELGAFELRVAGRPATATRYLERAQQLDPFGPAEALLASIG